MIVTIYLVIYYILMFTTVAYLSLGDCLAATNRYTEAETVLKKCLCLDGSKVKDIRSHVAAKKSCMLRLGRMFATIGKHQEAVKVFKSGIKTDESSSQVNHFLINIHFIKTTEYSAEQKYLILIISILCSHFHELMTIQY